MKTNQQAILVAVILATWLSSIYGAVADDAGDANRVLSEKMESVIFADPLKTEGTTSDQQFCDVLQKISDRYAERWNRPLPIRIDFEALQQLRSSGKDLNASIGLSLRDVPLPEMLRGWCVRVGLTFTLAHGAVLITTERKQVPN